MTDIYGKYLSLTPEQRVRFSAAKSEAELNKLLSETSVVLSEDERVFAMEHISGGKIELTDDEMDAVAGGKNENDLNADEQRFKTMAEKDGRKKELPKGYCGCTNLISVYAATGDCLGVVGTAHLYLYFTNCKCYNCGKLTSSVKLIN